MAGTPLRSVPLFIAAFLLPPPHSLALPAGPVRAALFLLSAALMVCGLIVFFALFLVYASVNVLILDNMTALNENNCWQLKHNSYVAINGWNKDEHIILYSNQLMLTHEFQTYFDALWNKENYSEGLRNKTILTLQNFAEQLRSNHRLS